MAINTGPSFMSNLGKAAPGMANALGQKYGGNLSGAAKGSASLLGKQLPSKGFRSPKVTTGMGNQPLPGTIMPMPQAPPMRAQAPGLLPSPDMGGEIQAQMPSSGIDTGPSQLFSQPYGNLFNRSSGAPGNTGVTGGLFNRPPGYERPNMGASGTDIGGMFGAYNRLAQQPGRRY